MGAVGRRQFFTASGAIFAAPLAFGGEPSPQSSSAQNSKPLPARPPLCPDLFDFVNHGLGQLVAKMRHGSLQSSDLFVGARNIKMIAHHVQDSGLNDSIRSGAAKFDPAMVDLSNPPGLDEAVQFLQKYDPTIARDDVLPQSSITPEALNTALDEVRDNGLIGVWFTLAKGLRAAAYGSSSSAPEGDEEAFAQRPPDTLLDIEPAVFRTPVGNMQLAELAYHPPVAEGFRTGPARVAGTSGPLGRLVSPWLMPVGQRACTHAPEGFFMSKKDLCDYLAIGGVFAEIAIWVISAGVCAGLTVETAETLSPLCVYVPKYAGKVALSVLIGEIVTLLHCT